MRNISILLTLLFSCYGTAEGHVACEKEPDFLLPEEYIEISSEFRKELFTVNPYYIKSKTFKTELIEDFSEIATISISGRTEYARVCIESRGIYHDIIVGGDSEYNYSYEQSKSIRQCGGCDFFHSVPAKKIPEHQLGISIGMSKSDIAELMEIPFSEDSVIFYYSLNGSTWDSIIFRFRDDKLVSFAVKEYI